ncbi:MAG: non-homologous end-joining DNA ligase [Thermoflavifilum sp.]|nr:non-homologous end-joining DNA ligase [Thermoflavifilum sp.]MCL6513930.1 non-homologous end-joining DNA ligase [Alicyclobacillus sp.]
MQLIAEHPVEITHPHKLLWPEAGIRKIDYLEYLAKMAPIMLPHLRDRPLTLIRWPDGVGGSFFYQKDAPEHRPSWVRTAAIWSKERGADIHYVLADSVATLLWLGNLAALELHTGFSRLNHPANPDWVAFDLDPSVPGFEPVREVALAVRDVLDELGVPSIPKLSGATGVQVLIPVVPNANFAAWKPFTRMVAGCVKERLPRRVTLERLKRDRGDKVYVDYPQHGAHRTLIAPYSARATRHATVAVPLRWDELEAGAVPEDFTIRNVPDRVHRIGDLLRQLTPLDPTPIVTFFQSVPVPT